MTDTRYGSLECDEEYCLDPNGIRIIVKKEGFRLDEGKERIDLVPPEIIFALGKILGEGLKKYPDRNWEKGMSWSRPFSSLQRHIWKWWGREDLDHETKQSHLAHAITNLCFLYTYEARGIGTDDRPIRR